MKQLLFPLKSSSRLMNFLVCKNGLAVCLRVIPRYLEEYLVQACTWVQEFLEADQPCFLAHGDLHQGNILESEGVGSLN